MSRRGYCRIVRLQNKLEIRVPSMVNHPDDHLSVPEETAVQEFVASFWGELIRPVDDGYDAARAVYNGMNDERPALIVRPTGTADVIDAVNLARENSLPLAIRCGGHSVAGNSVVDGGILIDLSSLKGVRVDTASRMARANAGVLWGEFDRETQLFGLVTPGGRVTTTGVGGFTLGGGYGWLSPKWGLACEPDLGRRRDRRWQAGNGKRGGERRPLVGHPRRQQQLRGGDFLRVPPPPFGSDRAGRLGPPPDR